MPPTTAATSSVTGPASSATAGRLRSARSINRAGQRWELQLKGAGPTPYSRSADGRAVLRSSIREFLCSEAMHHLGVPTTRALSLVATGESVVRDMFYDGNPVAEPGAIVCRVAPSFIRFGNFELPASRGDGTLVDALIDFTIRRDFPELLAGGAEPTSTRGARGVVRTGVRNEPRAWLPDWMRVGFVHGVMNTDNMSILGLTIDYGPYGWVDDFDPDWTPNTTDAGGRRYRFGEQPQIAQWNLGRLATAVAPLFGAAEPLQAGMNRYVDAFERATRADVAAKLGLDECRDADIELMQSLQALMRSAEIDMTIFFRGLIEIDGDSSSHEALAGRVLRCRQTRRL